MYTNFQFLKKDWDILAKIGEMAEYTLHKDPNTAIIKIRQLGEYIAKSMLKVERLAEPESGSQLDRIKILKTYDLIPEDIENILQLIRKKGNTAVHNMSGNESEAETLLSLVVKLCSWFNEIYGSDYSFNSELVQYKRPEKVDYKEAYEKLLSKVQEEEEKKKFEELIPENISFRTSEERIQLIKNKKNVELTEEETRALIDQQLRDAGWEADTINLNYKSNKTMPEKGRFMAIAEWPCIKEEGKNGYVDYALFYGNILYGTLEAKRKKVDVGNALKRESRMYSKGVMISDEIKLCEGAPFLDEYKAPFMFSSNGRAYNKELIDKSGIWFLDGRRQKNTPKALKGFYSPRDLKELLAKDEMLANKILQEEPMEYLKSKSGLGLRNYQIEAVKAVEEALIRGEKKVLLTMATGTGKTRTALAILYRLLKSKKYNRILFVVDRASLGEQAKDTFDNIKVDQQLKISEIYDIKGLKDKKPEDTTKIHVATVQGLMKRVLYSNDDTITVGQYDCIVIDEAHRGYILDRIPTEEEAFFNDEKEYQSKYRSVVDYFEADKIALTATPAVHTYEIFGEPVYQYSYRQAVLDGNLVDFEPPYRIITKLSSDGIHFEKGTEVKVFDSETQEIKVIKDLKDELDFDVDKFNTKVITEGFNRAVCSALVNYINPEGPEKTLVFAATDEHADMLVRVLREEFDKLEMYSMNNDMIEKITGSVKDVDKLIKKFKNENYPTIAITVDLLTTGIDVPKICNLVFLRKVRSRILYEQMIGRATRLCEEINKEYFKIYDAVDIYPDLKDYTDMRPVVADPKINLKKLLKDLDKIDDNDKNIEYLLDEVVGRIQRKKNRIKKAGSDHLKAFSNYIRGEEVSDINEYVDYLRNTPKEKIHETLVKEKEFLLHLDELKIAEKEKVISEHTDEIKYIKQDFGKAERPEDYLEGFREYILSSSDKIEAIKILKKSPQDFKKANLEEIIKVLDIEGYSKASLNAAYKQVKNEDILADMLTFIKNAIYGSPIVDREEKINDVMIKIKRLKNWSPKQKIILERIESLLRSDGYLTKEGFEAGILKETYGGYLKVDKNLEGMLDEILNVISKEIILN